MAKQAIYAEQLAQSGCVAQALTKKLASTEAQLTACEAKPDYTTVPIYSIGDKLVFNGVENSTADTVTNLGGAENVNVNP